MDNIILTDKEEKFCLIYANGPAPFNGNAVRCYKLVFEGVSGRYTKVDSDISEDVETALKANELVLRDDIKDRIDQLQSRSIVDATTLKPRLTETLLKIADECSQDIYSDRFGVPLSPAALRSVAVNAISKLSDMYGIKEDIAHKVMLEGADGEGITFNLVVPEKQADNQMNDLMP